MGLYQIFLAIILSLSPRLPASEAEIVARQVDSVATTREEAAMMLTISWYETGNRVLSRRLIPFGLSCCPNVCRRSLQECAQLSLRIVRTAKRCSNVMSKVFGYYHTGRCLPDPYSTRQATTYQRILRRIP